MRLFGILLSALLIFIAGLSTIVTFVDGRLSSEILFPIVLGWFVLVLASPFLYSAEKRKHLSKQPVDDIARLKSTVRIPWDKVRRATLTRRLLRIQTGDKVYKVALDRFAVGAIEDLLKTKLGENLVVVRA